MNQFKAVLETALAKLKEQEDEVVETKKTINTICKWDGQAAMFPDLEAAAVRSQSGAFRKDEFYGQALSPVVRQILEARKAANKGPASVGEIYEAMIQGGYKFDAANDENAKRALRVSLTKNTAMFHKIPSGEYGLKSWYPNIREPRQRNQANESSAAESASAESPVEQAGEDFDFEAKEKGAEMQAS